MYFSKTLLLIFVCLFIFEPHTHAQKRANQINKLFCEYEKNLSEGTSGIMIYEPATKKTWFKKNQNKLFLPASNVKILTLYSCLKTLGDSLEAIRYINQNDTLFFWGAGDPTLLHPDFPTSKTLDFLMSNEHKALIFSNENYTGQHLGSGWAWDDYNDYYQTELSPLPVFGNIVRFKTINNELVYSPVSRFIKTQSSSNTNASKIKRLEFENTFDVNFSEIVRNSNYSQDIPFIVKNQTEILSEAIGRDINTENIPFPRQFKVLNSLPVDTVYRRMMQVSDNMLAEHLLLMAGNKLSPEMSTEMAIANLTESFFTFLPNKIKWIDGSGLSRYNLLSPEALVATLDKMILEFPKEKVFSLLATSQSEGTLKNIYKNSSTPYVFAKSGSMGNVYNQSGYLITQKGKLLVFSIMNNGFMGGVSNQKNKVAEFVNTLFEKY